ncbi:MAG: hypothetical protein KC912_00500 [Proteobacteria bacterium]|nr:hypothetical protein [Pseudomonadota bacterium]
MRLTLPVLLLLSGCLLDSGLGPEVGECAEYPDGAYTYGEIGIGTCMAGPTDIRFIERDGQTFLAVANSDPYQTFMGGSVLLLDWDSLDLSATRNPTSTLTASAADTVPFLGQIAVADDTLLIPSRYSEDSRTVTTLDSVVTVDISDLSAPTVGDSIEVQQDPYPVAFDPESGLAYVVNVTGQSVSVVDTETLETLEISEGASVGPARFSDLDDSGSRAEIGLASVLTASAVPAETFTLTWIDVAMRSWLPSEGGVELWRGNGTDWLMSNFGLLLDPAEFDNIEAIDDPVFASVDGLPSLFFADGGDLFAVVSSYGETDLSLHNLELVLDSGAPGSFDANLSAPALLTFRDQGQLWYDARVDDGEPAVLARALVNNLGAWERGDALIEAPEGFESIEDPAVWPDGQTNSLRVFASLYDGTQWSIGLTESTDGDTFTPVEEVLRLDGLDIAAPTISWANGRYLMVASQSDGTAWSFVTSWSHDGRHWDDPVVFAESTDLYDGLRPPRAAATTDVHGFWRVEGDDFGFLENPATSAATWVSAGAGFSVRPASGHEVGLATARSLSSLGIEPASLATVNGEDVLYALATDGGGRTRLVALQRTATSWGLLADDILSVDGSVDGAVVVDDGDGFSLYFGQRDADGVTRMRRARSTDGLSFEVEAGNLTNDDLEWDGLSQIPHSAEVLDGVTRLWFAGSAGGQFRIGALRIEGDQVTRELGTSRDWLFGSGLPGEFDDSGVNDPLVFMVGETTHMLYTGSDGTTSRIGHATLVDGEWTREVDPSTERVVPAMLPVARTFSADSVSSPVMISTSGDEVEIAYAGSDGVSPRIGLASGTPDHLFGAHRFPTSGDTLEFTTTRGGPGQDFIELAQSTDSFTTTGAGATNARIDAERGFLYVPTNQNPHLVVIDIRDDSGAGVVDSNVHDMEGILRYTSTSGARGFRDAVPRPGTDLLYATATEPDGVLVFDLSDVADDSEKQAYDLSLRWSFPLGRAPQSSPNRPSQDEDEGSETFSNVTGAGMAMSPDGNTLLVTHARGNRVHVFDLNLGAYGGEIRSIEGVGEYPHVVRISPDGMHAVVANYVGEIEESGVEATLSVIDLDPTSPTWLQVVTRITNR